MAASPSDVASSTPVIADSEVPYPKFAKSFALFCRWTLLGLGHESHGSTSAIDSVIVVYATAVRSIWKEGELLDVVQPMTTPCCGDLLWSRVALNPSQVIQRSNLSTIVVFLMSISLCEESPKNRVSHTLHKCLPSKWSKEGSRNTHKSTTQQQHAHKRKERESMKQNDRVTSKKRA
jgi:hypothetical protein